MSKFTPVDTGKIFPREEIDEAFQHYWRLGGAGERWSEFADLYTEDAILIDRVIEGVKNGRQEIREYLDLVMNREMPALYTVYDWHTIQGNCVSNGMVNRFDNPDPNGEPLDFFGVTIQVYAGNGLWSFQGTTTPGKGCSECVRTTRGYAPNMIRITRVGVRDPTGRPIPTGRLGCLSIRTGSRPSPKDNHQTLSRDECSQLNFETKKWF